MSTATQVLPDRARAPKPLPKRVAIVACGSPSEVVACTPLAHQLALLEPGVEETWFTTAFGREVLRGNPDVTAIEVLPEGSAPCAATLAECGYGAVLEPLVDSDPAPPLGYSLSERIRWNSRLPWSVPPVPVLRLAPEEVRAAQRYCERLPAGRRVFVEAEPGDLDPREHDTCLRELVATFAGADVTIVLGAAEPPAAFAALRALHPRIVWCREAVRTCAAILELCELFVGFGGRYSALSRTDACDPDLPRVEFTRDATASSSGYLHFRDLEAAFDLQRFRLALDRASAKLVGRPVRDHGTTTRSGPVCPSCESDAAAPELRGFVRCTRCGLVREGEPGSVPGRELSAEYRDAFAAMARRLLGSPRTRRMLDLGAGLEGFLREVPAAESLDLVLAPHVLHTTRHARELIAKAHRALVPGGLLAIATPNAGSYARGVLRERWPWSAAALHFSATTLRAELVQAGFAVIAVHTPLGAARAETVLGALVETVPKLQKHEVPGHFERLLRAWQGEELVVVGRKRGRRG